MPGSYVPTAHVVAVLANGHERVVGAAHGVAEAGGRGGGCEKGRRATKERPGLWYPTSPGRGEKVRQASEVTVKESSAGRAVDGRQGRQIKAHWLRKQRKGDAPGPRGGPTPQCHRKANYSC